MKLDLIENRQIRIFISSTFRDMQAERDYLVQKVFPSLRRYCEERYVSFQELDLRWGVTEEDTKDGKVVDICLKEIQQSTPFFIGLLGERYGWVPDKDERWKIAEKTEVFKAYPWVEEELKNGTSITEIEIQEGVLRAEEAGEKVNAYFYFRSDTPRMEIPDNENFKEKPGSDAAKKLQRLKDTIRKQKPDHVSEYDDPERLGELVDRDFKALADRLFPLEKVPSELERERLEQRAFLKRMTAVYVPFPESEKHINDFVESAERGLVIHGESGMGKSALLAYWIQNREKQEKEKVIYHFIGRSGDEGNYRKITWRLIEEIKELYKLPPMPPNEQSGNDDDRQKKELENLLFAVRDTGRLVIILDGVDKLSDGSAKELMWLPVFPDNVKFIFSIHLQKGDATTGYFVRMKYRVIEVTAPDVERRKTLIVKYLDSFGKKLAPPQIDRIAGGKENENPLVKNPLALCILLDELRMFGKYEELDTKINEYLGANSIPELFTLVLDRCEKTFNYGKGNFVQEALSLLYVAQRGLSETEICAFTGAKPLYRSQLFYGIASHLLVRSGMVTLSHRFIRDAVKNRYLPDGTAVGKYRMKFVESMSDPYAAVSPRRKYNEVAYQLFECADWDKLHRILLDFKVLGYLGIHELAKYWQALRGIDRKKYAIEEYLKLDTGGRTTAKMSGLFQELCDVAMVLRDTSLAAAFANEVIRLDPNNAAACYRRGGAYFHKGDYDRAIADYSEAIRLDPNYTWAYNDRGTAYLNGKKDYDRANAEYPDAVRCDPNFAMSYYNRGSAYQNGKEDYDRAIADYTEALRIDPNYAYAYINRGAAYQNGKRDYDKAIADYTEALHLSPNNTLATRNLAAARKAKNISDRSLTKTVYSVSTIFTGLIILAGVSYSADRLGKEWLHSLAIILNIVGIVWFAKTIIVGMLKRIRPSLVLVVFQVLRILSIPLDIGLSVHFVKGREAGNPVSVFLQNPFEAARNLFGAGKDDKTDMQADILPPAPQGVNNTDPATGTADKGAKHD
jgi:tetratricopeptide (TPR) repeat protein